MPEQISIESAITIFVSYGHADAIELAARLAKDLEAAGYHVWLDLKDIKPGSDWEGRIEAAILQAGAILALLTPHAVERPDGVCLDEIAFARHQRKPIIPAMVITCRPPLGVFRLDWVDLRGWQQPERYREGFRSLLEAIRHHGSRPAGGTRICERLQALDFGSELARYARRFSGRAWLLEEIHRLLTASRTRTLIVTGDPGTGKSAMMARLVEKHARVAAYHFCVDGLRDSLDPGLFVRSIAAQLATQIPSYREVIEPLNLEEIAASDPFCLWRRLLVDPLRAVSLEDACILVVDALDEAWGPGQNIPKLLRWGFEDLPPAFKLVASSRKEAAVLDLFGRYCILEIDPARPENSQDIQEYVGKRLLDPVLQQRLHGLSAEDFALAVSRRSGGNFLFVTNVLRDLEEGTIDPQNPDFFPAGLVGIYQRFFERLFPGERGFEQIRPLLDVILAAREPLDPARIARFCACDDYDVSRNLEPLEAFFPLKDGKYAPYHLSISDWLGGRSGQSRRFRVHVARGHRLIAQSLWKDYCKGDRSLFTVQHLPFHLAQAGEWDSALQVFRDVSFLEAACRQGAHNLEQSIALVADAMPQGDARALLLQLQRVLRLESHWLQRDPGALPGILYNRLRASAWDEEHVTARIHFPSGLPRLRLRSPVDLGGEELRTLSGHAGGVTACAWTPDGHSIISGSFDESLKIWDAETGLEMATLHGHWGRIASCFSTPRGEIVSASWDGTLRVWDIATQECTGAMTGHKGRIRCCVAAQVGSLALSGGDDCSLRIWDLQTRSEQAVLSGHKGPILSCAASASARRALSASKDRTVGLWDLETGRLVHFLGGHRRAVCACAITPDGRLAASASMDGTIFLWDLNAGGKVAEFRRQAEEVAALTLGADGRRLIIGSSSARITVLDLESGKEIRTFRGHGWGVTACALSPDGRRLASSSWDQTLKIWDLAADPVAPVSPESHSGLVRACAATPDARRLVTVSADGCLKIWDAATARLLSTKRIHGSSVNACAIAPDGKRLVTASMSGTVKIWDIENSRNLGSFGCAHGPIFDCAVTPDGRRVVCGCRDATLIVRDLESGEEVAVLEGHDGWILACAIEPRNRLLVSASRDGTVKLWSLDTFLEIATLRGHDAWVHSCAVTPDGRFALSSSKDRTLRLWDLGTHRSLQVFRGHSDWVFGCTITPDGRRAVSASWDRTLKFWDLATGACIQTVYGVAPFRSVCAGPGFICAGDETGNVWILSDDAPGEA